MDNKDNWNLRLLKDEYERQDQRMFRWADHIDKMARLQKLQAIAMFVIAGFMPNSGDFKNATCVRM